MQKTDLALQAMRHLGASGHMKGTELAGSIGTTGTYIAHVVQPLVQRGWVESAPGPTGGYTLEVPLAGLSVLDIIEAVEGTTDTDVCVLSGAACPSEGRCVVHEAWKRASAALLDELAGIPVVRADTTQEVPT